MKKVVIFSLIAICILISGLTAVALRPEAHPNRGVAPTLSVEPVVNGFTQPIDIANAGDNRLFVAERAGYIYVIEDGATLSTPFLDIDARVDSASHSERGLLGLAFHPDYPSTPYFYVNYINSNGDTTISRFTANDAQNVADPDSEKILLTIEQPERNHNAGDLNFGEDGYLYIASGDGGSGGDPFGEVGNGQERQTLLGKILRIDVDNGDPYAIPADNPFVDDPTTLDEIWALGLRNPWRFSFDRQTGDMFIADVGQNLWEEVNYVSGESTGGENYGWRCYEATHAFNLDDCGPTTDYVFPIAEYPHDNLSDPNDEGFSITGGYVYRGELHTDLQGIYLYGDFVTSNVWMAIPDGGGGWTIVINGPISGLASISTFGEGCNGELYVASYGGSIFKIATAVTAPTPALGPIQIYLPILMGGSDSSRFCTSALYNN
ncbi:MAG: PQQ-dependent sugar dehydrogenase [Chloroflexota bacterium]